MKFLLKLLLSALIVVFLAKILPGIHVDSYTTAIFIALSMALLNMFIKPLLILFTLPATILTLGLFLLVINAVIVLLASHLVDGFTVTGFWPALLFSLLFSPFQSIITNRVNSNY
jgi:putative membrane protein